MSEGRDPPAFQVYAATVLAKREHRMQSLAARGLTHTMNLELWINKSLPADPAALAAFLGQSAAEVTALLPACMPFFAVENGEIISPELEAYRAHLLRIKESQSKGGKLGASKTNAVHAKPTRRKSRLPQGVSNDSGNPSGNPSGNSQVTRESLVKLNPVKSNSTASAVEPGIKVTTGEVVFPADQRKVEGA